MNLRIFFDTIKVPSDNYEPSSWVNYIQTYSEEFPDWQNADIAIIGITEERGSVHNKGAEKAADAVRKKLYHLKKGSGSYKIADLGNLRLGVNLQESYLRLKEVCELLLQHKVLPVLIGGTQDMDFGQFLAYEGFNNMISILNVDSAVDMYGSDEFGMSRHHIHKMLVHEPNFVFHYSHLAYQSYLNDPETISVLEKLYFETYRLGQIRESIEEIEPVIRNADMMTFDVGAIRQSDAPGNKNAQPFGLTGEEACQIAWYAGLNAKMSSVGFYEYNPEEDVKGQTAGVIATMIWYFVEGYYLRKDDFDLNDPKYVKYIVSFQHEPHKLTFYKNSQTEKWWMEVPFPSNKTQYARNSIVPCSYNDYQAANKGELPNRYILTHAKLI
ncbi:MAG: formimidoylglutamase [Cytophagaceae bacterium]|nr:formimidoylglutamase [Cytophagaceae bacterium]